MLPPAQSRTHAGGHGCPEPGLSDALLRPGTQLGGARSYATERLSRPDTSSEWGWENFQKPKFTLDWRGGGGVVKYVS